MARSGRRRAPDALGWTSVQVQAKLSTEMMRCAIRQRIQKHSSCTDRFIRKTGSNWRTDPEKNTQHHHSVAFDKQSPFSEESPVIIQLFESERIIDALHERDDHRLPGDQVPDPVEQLAVEQMRLLPRVLEHARQVDLLTTVRTRLLLAHDAPAADAELVESAVV